MRTRERHEIYKAILAECEENKETIGLNFVYGFCYALKPFLDLYKYDYLNLSVHFPEIYKHKPGRLDRRNDAYWFNRDKRGDNKRLAILKQAIRETQPKRKTR